MDLSHRRFSKRIRFTDKAGNPLKNSEIKVQMTNHKFLFGCGAFDFIPHVTEGGENFKQITDSWQEIFNYGTLPFYWGRYEPVEGKPNKEALMKTAENMKEKGIKVKGNPLCWHTACADWLMKYDNATIMQKQLERIDGEVSGFKGDYMLSCGKDSVTACFENDEEMKISLC
ncbi:MAG: hypothetical protein K6F63_05385 [Lachnospiraceae bacterium]|nr:hypothetical protein [Lachnospiraceae bacterium]